MHSYKTEIIKPTIMIHGRRTLADGRPSGTYGARRPRGRGLRLPIAGRNGGFARRVTRLIRLPVPAVAR